MVKRENKTRKNKSPKSENRLITVNYSSHTGALSEDEKKRLMRNIKKEKYYYDYLSGKFRFVFIDKSRFTEGRFLWQGGAGDHGEASDRVLNLLLGDFDVLPDGIKSKLVGDREVSFKSLGDT